MDRLPKSYKKMTRKELKKHLLHEMQCNEQIVKDNRNIVQTNMVLNKIVEKYKDLLSHSVENL
jgi:capsular polysaccharide biosynthesis protein